MIIHLCICSSIIFKGSVLDFMCAGGIELRQVAPMSTICWSKMHLPNFLVARRKKRSGTRLSSTTPCSQIFENGIWYGRTVPDALFQCFGRHFSQASD